MKTIRITIGALAAVGAMAMAALGAASASAEIAPLSKFVATKVGGTFPLKVRGHAVGPQVFKFKGLEVKCEAAKAKGEMASEESETLELAIAYKECESGPVYDGGRSGGVGYLPTHFREKAQLTYSYAGWIVSSEEVEMVQRGLRCITDWAGETYPEKAAEKPTQLFTAAQFKTETVENANETKFPTKEQKKLLITNEVKGKGLEWEGEGEGVCENFEVFPEGERGKYTGKLLLEVPGGNLEFKEPAV